MGSPDAESAGLAMPPRCDTNSETALADDADDVLMQWRVDAGHMRVIYGDLTIETVQEPK